MTAPVSTLAAKFTAEGSETVRQAIDRVTRAATTAAERTTRAAAAAAARTAELAQVQGAIRQRSVQAAERAAYAEDALRQRSAQQAIETSRRMSAAQSTHAAQTGRAVSDRYGMMALSVSSSLNQMAFTGKVTGAGLRNVLVQTGAVATSVLGKGGPWAAAISVAALALTSFFARAKAEQEEFARSWSETMKRLVNAHDLRGLRDQARDLWEGTAAEKFRDGLGPRLQRLGLPFATVELLERELALADRLARTRTAGMRARAEEIRQVIELRKRYDELLETISPKGGAPARRIDYPTATITIGAGEGPTVPAVAIPTSVTERGVTRVGAPDLSGLLTPRLPDPTRLATKSAEEIIEAFRANQSTLSLGISDALVGGIAGGIMAAALSGSIDEALRAMTASVLAGLGDMFAQIAVRAIAMSKAMIAFQAFLTANPVVALAAAVAMLVLAQSMGGGRRGGGFGGGGFSSAGAAASASNESATRIVFGQGTLNVAAGMTPRVFVHNTIIGPDDPRAQRAIGDLLAKIESRGARMGG